MTTWKQAALVIAGAILTIGTARADGPQCEPSKLAERYPGLVGKTLKIGGDPQTPPYVMRDPANFEKIVGFDADLARAVFDCAGIKTEFFIGGWSGLLPALIAGQIDVFWDDLYYTEARAKQADYIVYMQAGTGALVAAGNPRKITGMDALCGTTVAVGLGTVEQPQVQKADQACQAAGKEGITMLTFPDVAGGIRLVQGERADVMLYDLALIDKLVKDNPTHFTRGFSVLSGFGIGVAVKKGNDELTRAIFDNLKVIQDTGVQTKIFEAYTIDPALGMPATIKTQ